jgi:peptide/nickel transport system permease protein
VASTIGRDYPMVMAITVVVAVVVILSNLLVDLTYGWLDPRITYG